MTKEEVAFYNAYTATRIEQELKGVVNVKPEQVRAKMQNISQNDFNSLLSGMASSHLLCVLDGAVWWNE